MHIIKLLSNCYLNNNYFPNLMTTHRTEIGHVSLHRPKINRRGVRFDILEHLTSPQNLFPSGFSNNSVMVNLFPADNKVCKSRETGSKNQQINS